MRHALLLSAVCIAAIVAVPAATNAQQISSQDSVEVYAAALRMFSPRSWPLSRRTRWLDARFLESTSNEADAIPLALLEDILTRLGDGFETMPANFDSDTRTGGIVRIAMIRMISARRAIVEAQYTQRSRYHSGPTTNMILTVIRKGGQWRLVPQ